jgi:hypothetical protein
MARATEIGGELKGDDHARRDADFDELDRYFRQLDDGASAALTTLIDLDRRLRRLYSYASASADETKLPDSAHE